MNTMLKTNIIKIGNSQGVRIPKIWLDQLQLGKEIEMSIEAGQIVIRPAHSPRHLWAEQFRDMAAHHEDVLLDGMVSTQWEEEEWEW